MKPLNTNEIAQRIKYAREAKGYSYQKMAELTGMSKSTLQRYETGSIKNIPLSRLQVLSAALQISPGELLGWNDDMGLSDFLNADIDLFSFPPVTREQTACAAYEYLKNGGKTGDVVDLSKYPEEAQNGIKRAYRYFESALSLSSPQYKQVNEYNSLVGNSLPVFSPLKDQSKKLLEFFEKLNTEGQNKAVERVSELTEIPKYRKESSETQKAPSPSRDNFTPENNKNPE